MRSVRRALDSFSLCDRKMTVRMDNDEREIFVGMGWQTHYRRSNPSCQVRNKERASSTFLLRTTTPPCIPDRKCYPNASAVSCGGAKAALSADVSSGKLATTCAPLLQPSSTGRDSFLPVLLPAGSIRRRLLGILLAVWPRLSMTRTIRMTIPTPT